MSLELTIDKAGRVVIPKQVRDQLQLQPGDTLRLETEGEQITLRPKHPGAPVRKKGRLWVCSGTGQTLRETLVEDTLQAVREERRRRILGE